MNAFASELLPVTTRTTGPGSAAAMGKLVAWSECSCARF
jgi:hypothetical protein